MTKEQYFETRRIFENKEEYLEKKELNKVQLENVERLFEIIESFYLGY